MSMRGGEFSSWLSDYVNQGGFAALYYGNGAFEGRAEVIGIGDGAFAVHAVGLSHFCVVDEGIGEGGADVSAVHAAVGAVAHQLDLHQFLMIAAVVVHDGEKRDLVVARGPEDAGGVVEVAVALDIDTEAPVFLIGQRSTDCRRG